MNSPRREVVRRGHRPSDNIRRLDQAQQHPRRRITLRLDTSTTGVNDKKQMIQMVERIILLMRDKLLHHASAVETAEGCVQQVKLGTKVK